VTPPCDFNYLLGGPTLGFFSFLISWPLAFRLGMYKDRVECSAPTSDIAVVALRLLVVSSFACLRDWLGTGSNASGNITMSVKYHRPVLLLVY
jgi:hypothetical protein